ncbi:sulfatase-like hydrolase/transferase [Saliphagus sp. LR7]|uniref:sulfatase-like hydrolase/transferase n=1 Tax=Saliphagus sp. LR7 TaxID=2282654 RepID=UPI000DF86718|nr:sulfatase-like hydrolase/transferase [Saliphagus sp. LR7]
MEAPTNVLFVLSDEHRPDALGCAGHRLVETPALDRLAETGTRCTAAYCSSPLCAPSRASLATGRYVHEIGFWDNATPYDGEPASWGRHFSERGIDVTTVGKLDFEPSVDDGFDDQRVPFHRETPDVNGLYREPPIQREDARERIHDAGPADSDDAWYRAREEAVTATAIDALESKADSDEEGWVINVNYILPHFPLRAEPSYYDQYPVDEVDLPIDNPAGDNHPILEELRDHFDGRNVDESVLRRTRAAYYGLCSAFDDSVDRLLGALEELGLAEETLVLYASDHGEPLGDHEIWWKCCMYEPSVGVPLIARGPGVEAGATIDSPTSLLDVVPTMADAMGIKSDPRWRGQSLLPALTDRRGADPDRSVFSEYHAHGTSRGMFMLRRGRFKYVFYPDHPDQLFDLENDPDERDDLSGDPEYNHTLSELESELRTIVDPEAADEQARRDQQRRLAELTSDSDGPEG